MDFDMANYAPRNQVGSNRIPNARRSAFDASNATLGFEYSAMMRGIPFLIVIILKSCLLRIGFKKRNGSVFA